MADARVIIDSNVIFSGLGGPLTSFPARVVASVTTGAERLVLSELLMDEFQRVLVRPSAKSRHRLTDGELSAFLAQLRTLATVVEPGPGPPCPDPDDQHLWDLLATVEDSILVTGERALLESHHFPGRVLSPRQFVEQFGNEWAANA